MPLQIPEYHSYDTIRQRVEELSFKHPEGNIFPLQPVLTNFFELSKSGSIDWDLYVSMLEQPEVKEGSHEADIETTQAREVIFMTLFEQHLSQSLGAIKAFSNKRDDNFNNQNKPDLNPMDWDTIEAYTFSAIGKLIEGEMISLKKRIQIQIEGALGTESLQKNEQQEESFEEQILRQMVFDRVCTKIKDNQIPNDTQSTRDLWARIRTAVDDQKLTKEDRNTFSLVQLIASKILRDFSSEEIATLAQQQMRGIWHSTVKQVKNRQ